MDLTVALILGIGVLVALYALYTVYNLSNFLGGYLRNGSWNGIVGGFITIGQTIEYLLVCQFTYIWVKNRFLQNMEESRPAHMVWNVNVTTVRLADPERVRPPRTAPADVFVSEASGTWVSSAHRKAGREASRTSGV